MELIERVYRLNPALASSLKRIIWKYAEEIRRREGKDFKIKLMNFCGTHEWTTVHFGLRSLMPENVELVAGPGCPVCITPAYYVDQAIKLAFDGITVYTFGDAYRLPTVRPVKGARSLMEAKGLGAEVKLVYSFLDAVEEAKRDCRTSVFFGIGFETTAPSYAMVFTGKGVPSNLLFLSILRLTPPAAKYAVQAVEARGLSPIQGIIAPGHVSTITGAKPWDEVSRETGIPAVISGFEPIDLLMSVALLLKMIKNGEVGVRIEYLRAVSWEGNLEAQSAIRKVFYMADAPWRGIGFIPKSGLKLRQGYGKYDAFRQLGLKELSPEEWKYDLPPECRCAEVTLGMCKPPDCPLFMKSCTPDKPWGPCMVSIEGTCAVWARFGGGGLADVVGKELGLV